MILIGTTGPIGHGKTTFAQALLKLEPSTVQLETNIPIIDVANGLQAALTKAIDPYDVDQLNEWLQALPGILSETLDIECDFSQIELDPIAVTQHPVEYQKLILHAENIQRDFSMAQKQITDTNKENYRPLLQWLGGYLTARINPGIWVNEIIRRTRIAAADGAKICVVGGLRYPTDAAILRGAGATILKIYRPGHLQNDMLDPTERERDNIQVDCTIMSNGTVEDVETFAVKFLEDLRSNNLQTLYHTA